MLDLDLLPFLDFDVVGLNVISFSSAIVGNKEGLTVGNVEGLSDELSDELSDTDKDSELDPDTVSVAVNVTVSVVVPFRLKNASLENHWIAI